MRLARRVSTQGFAASSLLGELIGDWKPVGDKVIELRVDTGPGYRIYGHVRGSEFILLLIGGDKSTQQADIAKAKDLLKKWEAQNGRQR